MVVDKQIQTNPDESTHIINAAKKPPVARSKPISHVGQSFEQQAVLDSTNVSQNIAAEQPSILQEDRVLQRQERSMSGAAA